MDIMERGADIFTNFKPETVEYGWKGAVDKFIVQRPTETVVNTIVGRMLLAPMTELLGVK